MTVRLSVRYAERSRVGPDGADLSSVVPTNSSAALIYQHASRQVDQTIANKLSTLIEGMTDTTNDRDDDDENGPTRVRVPAG